MSWFYGIVLFRILPKENLERVRRILQTPPSARRLDRFSTTGSPRSLESTPEPMPVPQPTSILKSGAKRRLHKDSETGLRKINYLSKLSSLYCFFFLIWKFRYPASTKIHSSGFGFG